MRKLKVGIIGVGMAFERLHYPAYQKLTDRYEIAALCDLDKVKADMWADRLKISHKNVYTEIQDILDREDLDVVDIMVPIELNFKVTEAVAKRLAGQKKGIICEKPLAPTLEQARAARDLAQKYNVPIMIAENFRHNQEIDIIRDLIRTKRIGDVIYFIQNRVVDFPGDMLQDKFSAKEWRQHPEFPGGAITDTGVHDLAGLRHIFGPIDRLQAFGRPQASDFAPYSAVNVNLLFKSGVTGQFTFFCAGKEMQRPLIGLRIFGTEGMIYLEGRDVGTINLAFNDGRKEQIPYEAQKGYYNELINFYNALTGSEPISVTPEMEFGDLKTVHDILLSIKEGRIISVDEHTTYRPDYQQALAEQPGFLQ
ncbi:Gfo/Idh/MocA family protein [Desulfocucumis palustris]|uniref:Gfo/Idh/MocA family protein n=1 Tax=Desulfocucumis palustris TaxID=1898651 RepID=UPI000CE9F107|nr:Gfo/Idh/MocA family oxidoreductase [Desulfocucumis palustris]